MQGSHEITKAKYLDIIRLLSALESWSFSTKSTLPDYLLEDLQAAVDLLSKEVLN